MKLYFVRHGDTQRGVNGVYGYSAPLSELGTVQAEQTARYMSQLRITHIASSDAVRALQTAEPFKQATGLSLDVIPELTEIDIGVPSDGISPIKENRTPDGRYIMDCTHLGGESWEQFRERVRSGLGILDDRFAGDDVIAVFTHGGVKSVALDHYLGREPTSIMHTPFDNGSISIVESADAGHVVHGVNDISHLY